MLLLVVGVQGAARTRREERILKLVAIYFALPQCNLRIDETIGVVHQKAIEVALLQLLVAVRPVEAIELQGYVVWEPGEVQAQGVPVLEPP